MNALPRLAAPALVAAALVLAPSPASAVSFNYCDFSSTAGLSVNNNASQQGNVLTLTPNLLWQRGSAFTTASFPFDATTSFHTFFRFRAGPNPAGADGFVFVLQSGGPTAIGNAGLGIGYDGIPSSFAVEFDTYDNGATDPDANHVAVLFDGDNMTHVATATPPFAIAGGKDGYVWIDYDAPNQALDVYLADVPFKPTAPLLSKAVNIDMHLGPNVRAGFTSATGGVANVHQILEWQMSTDGVPCCQAAPNGACSAPVPACIATGTGGMCVECSDNTHCSPLSPVCVANACGPCSVDDDCTGNAGGPACAPTGACVACTSDTGCAQPSPRCDTSTYKCVACLSGTDCAAPKPACDPVTRTCVGCFDDSGCPAATPVCDAQAKHCVAGCHVVAGKDSCGPGTMCDKLDGTIGDCQPVGSSSGMASSSTSSGSGGAGGSAGAGGTTTGSGGTTGAMGGSGGTAGAMGGAGGAAAGGGGQGPTPLDGGCGCRIAADSGGGTGLAAAALVAAALAGRRRRRAI